MPHPLDIETRTVFPYPGAKTTPAPWIIDHFPAHECYVEPFGGAASVLFRKPKSRIEIYNDRDGDVVQFFDVLRDRSEELVGWLEAVPYARDLYETWATAYYAGERPDDPIERAGRFFFLRYAQTVGKFNGKGGFGASRVRNDSHAFAKSVADLETFAARFRKTVIENKDYAALIDHYDGPKTLFYFDPPYHGGESMYPAAAGFDRTAFYDALAGIEGFWLVSYSEIPDALAGYHTTESAHLGKMNTHHKTIPDKTIREVLIMNYDPGEVPLFSGTEQTTLTALADDDDPKSESDPEADQ